MGLCRCKSGGAAEMRMVIAVAIELPDREHVQPGVHHGSQGQSACALDYQELFRLAVFTLHWHKCWRATCKTPQNRGKSARSDPYTRRWRGRARASTGNSVIICATSDRTPCFLCSSSDVLKLIHAISSRDARLYEALRSPSHLQPLK